MNEEENKKHLTHNAKVKCVLCVKVGFSSDNKGLTRHLRLAHSKKYFDDLFIEVEDDIPVDMKPTDKVNFKKMVNRLKNQKKKKDNALTCANHKKPKRKSIYWVPS